MRITSIRTTSILGDLQYWSYGYTPAGDIEEIHNIVTDVTYDYTYDELHRLLSETSGGDYPTISYTYNAIGNIMSKTYGTNSYAYTYDTTRKHAVANINFNGNNYAYTYDGNGNMTAGPDFTDPTQTATRAITYNADNLPTNIAWTKAATVTSAFTYDGSGTRVKKAIQGGSTTWYIGSHYEKKDSTYTKYIFAGGTRIAKVTTSGYHILHGDHLGSSTVISDSSGAIAESTEYNPFGTTRTHSGATLTNYKYTDQELDPETGLYNYGARYYDPMIGRFISPDPIVQAPFNPQSLNRYSYCINSPLMYVDPSGNIFGIDDFLIAVFVGAIIGGTISELAGGDFWSGAFMGAISGGLFFGAGEIIGHLALQGVTAAGVHAAAGCLSGAISSMINGGDMGTAILVGGLSAGLAKYGGDKLFGKGGLFATYVKTPVEEFTAQLLFRTTAGGLTGGFAAELAGGNFRSGFANGAKTAAIGVFCNGLFHEFKEMILHRYWVPHGDVLTVTGEWEQCKSLLGSTPQESFLAGNFHMGYVRCDFQRTVSDMQTGHWDFGFYESGTITRALNVDIEYTKTDGFVYPMGGYSGNCQICEKP